MLAAVAVLVVALAGCGKQEHAVVIADPAAEALAHAPAGAAALAVIATDTHSGPGATLAALGRRFPGGELVVGHGEARLADALGLDEPTQLRPLLGNPLVLWSRDGTAAHLYAAWVVRDGEALGKLLAAQERRGALRTTPDEGDYAVWTRRDGSAVARRGPVVVVAPEPTGLREALRRRAAGRGQWDAALLRERSLGLPGGAVARVALDARALTVRRPAARVPWVAAFQRAALTLTPEAGGLRLRARVSTDAGRLAPDDVPIAPGVEPPETRGSAPITAAVRDAQHTLRFARRTTDLLDPHRLDGLRQTEAVLAKYARVSLQEDLLDRLTGTLTLTSRDGRTGTLRADLDDPGRTADALGRVGALARFGGPLASLAGVDLGGFDVDERDGRYVLKQDGKLLVALQVVDGALVASTDPGADLVAAGRAPAGAPVPTAGAFRATVAADLVKDRLVTLLRLPAFARGALGPLGAPIVTARGERGLFDVQVVLPVAG